jgi:hypothetical protein
VRVHLPQSSSASRLTAGAAGFLLLIQCRGPTTSEGGGVQCLGSLFAPAQYLFDSLHDWHLKILLVATIIIHLAHIFFQGLQINHSVVAFGIVVTAEPCGDEPRLADFVMHELVTVDLRNVDRHLGVGRPGGCKGKDGYQGDADCTSVA